MTPQVEASGTATIQVAPDLIQWTLQLSDTGVPLKEVTARNAAKMEQVLKLLQRELNIPDEKIQTGQLNVSRVYGNSSSDFLHWKVQRTIQFTQTDIKRFDEYVATLFDQADLEASYSFDTSRRRELRFEARKQAVQVARRKAEEMVAAVGKSTTQHSVVRSAVGAPLRIAESAPRYMHSGFGNYLSNTTAPAAEMPADADAIQGTLAPGSISISESVVVIFAINYDSIP